MVFIKKYPTMRALFQSLVAQYSFISKRRQEVNIRSYSVIDRLNPGEPFPPSMIKTKRIQ